MILDGLKEEMKNAPSGEYCPDYFRAQGYASSNGTTVSQIRADGIAALFTAPKPACYPRKNDTGRCSS